MPQIGIITEQNDLGLGFDLLNQNDQKTYNESAAQNESKDDNEQK